MHYLPLLDRLFEALANSQLNGLASLIYKRSDGISLKSSDELRDVRAYQRGFNLKPKYTPLFKDNCGSNLLIKDITNHTQPSLSESILLVSNLVCYSACSAVANLLQEVHNFKIIAYSGLKYKQATIKSIFGIDVVTTKQLTGPLAQAGLANDPDAPKLFLRRTTFDFTHRSAMLTRSKLPQNLEFTWLPAKKHLHFNIKDAFDPHSI